MTKNSPKSFGRQIAAPVIITIILCLMVLGQIVGTFFLMPELEFPLWGTFLGIGVPLVFIGLMAYVLVERIKDVKSGEEDDLDNY